MWEIFRSFDFEKIKRGETLAENKKIHYTYTGVGTNLTNDIPGVEPLNVVIKVVRCNKQPVAKISDSAGKMMLEDESYVSYLKQTFGIK